MDPTASDEGKKIAKSEGLFVFCIPNRDPFHLPCTSNFVCLFHKNHYFTSLYQIRSSIRRCWIKNMDVMPRFIPVTPTPRNEVVPSPPLTVNGAHAGEGVGVVEITLPNWRMGTTEDELSALLLMESTGYKAPRNYLTTVLNACGTKSLASQCVTEQWRRRLCEWMFEVVDHFSFDREVVSVAFDYLDRSVSWASCSPESGKALSKREYQLHAVTSLYLAIKVHGEMDGSSGERLKLRISAFEDLSRGFFSVETIEAKERELLSLFQWRVNPPTCTQFLSYFLRLLPDWSSTDLQCSREDIVSQIFDISKYLTELSLFCSKFTFDYKPSTVAYAAILCALESLQATSPFPTTIQLQFLRNIREVSDCFTPDCSSIRDIELSLKKLAPKMFTPHTPPLPRIVSLLDVGTANHLAATSRAHSPISVYDDDGEDDGNGNITGQPHHKRQKIRSK